MTNNRVKNPKIELTPEQRRQRIELLQRQISQIQENIGAVSIPMAEKSEDIRQLLKEHEHVVIVGETGSGKSTILPLILLEILKQEEIEYGYAGRIAVTQPRVIAATSVSRRVADINKSIIGEEIGYLTGKESKFDQDKTDVCFLTEKIIINQFKNDQLLREYSIVMVDEAHERSLNIDFLIGILKLANQKRTEVGMRPIRIIITSATIEKERFARYISDGNSEDNHAQVSGRTFEVERVFSDREIPESGYTRSVVSKTQEILKSGEEGDILVFLPGKAEITEVEVLLNSGLSPVEKSGVTVHPLHSEISPEAQQAVFKKSGKRKIILATNIAETSITLEGVKHVIDSGFIKQSSFRNGIKVLETIRHSQKGLIQRMGRAGRVQAGKAHLLYTEDEFRRRQEFTTPEIQRSDLSEVILTLISVGIKDINHFPFIDKPSTEDIEKTIISLQELGAIDKDRNLTPAGEFMIKIPAEPRISRIIYEATKVRETEKDIDPLRDVIIMASFMQVSRSIFARESRGIDRGNNHDSDLTLLVSLFNEYLAAPDKYRFCEQKGLNYRAMQDVSRQRQDLLEAVRKGGVTVSDSKGLNPAVLGNIMGRILVSGATSANIFLDPNFENISEINGPRTYISRESYIKTSGEVVLSFSPSQAVIKGRNTRFLNLNHRISMADLKKHKPELFQDSGLTVMYDYRKGTLFLGKITTIKSTLRNVGLDSKLESSDIDSMDKTIVIESLKDMILNICTRFRFGSSSIFIRELLEMIDQDSLLTEAIANLCYENKILDSDAFFSFLEKNNNIKIIGSQHFRTVAFRDKDGVFRINVPYEKLGLLQLQELIKPDGIMEQFSVTTFIPEIEASVRVSTTASLSSLSYVINSYLSGGYKGETDLFILNLRRIKNLEIIGIKEVEVTPKVKPEEILETPKQIYIQEPIVEKPKEMSITLQEKEKQIEVLKNRYIRIFREITQQIYEIDKSEMTQASIRELEIIVNNGVNEYVGSEEFYALEEGYEFFYSEYRSILERVKLQALERKIALEKAERARQEALEAQRIAQEQALIAEQQALEAQRVAEKEAERRRIEREREARRNNALCEEDLKNGVNSLADALGARVRPQKGRNR